jgi:hypothetical protein
LCSILSGCAANPQTLESVGKAETARLARWQLEK